MEALSRAKIPVTLCAWNYAPQLDEWELVIATPWYDSKGPLKTYSSFTKAFQDAGIYQDVPVRRIKAKGPKDALVKDLTQRVKDENRVTIHIIGSRASERERRYSVVFAPFAGAARAVPVKRFSGVERLRRFLEARLEIVHPSVEQALAELAQEGNASIPNIRLTPGRRGILGWHEPKHNRNGE
jgi:hypothetical protein